MTGAASWLEPLLPSITGLTDLDTRRLETFENALVGLLAEHPVGPGIDPRLRSQRLLRIRRELAGCGQLALAVPTGDGGHGRPAALQVLMNFVCGYHDTDLRDATGLGHGRLISRHGTAAARVRWLPRLLDGDLAGIAITEPHGGSQVHATTTTATAHRDGTWRLTGTKTWISRLHEAAVFIVFFTNPAGHLSAGIIDAADPGLHREPILPAGLTGWSWGKLGLHEAALHPPDILGRPGEGMTLVREHFAHYRPLVAATGLGTATAVHDHVTRHLAARRDSGAITNLRDNALITLGHSYAQINAALLATLTACHLSETSHPLADMWSCAIKACAIDNALTAATDLALLTGASSFTASSPLAKATRDLSALRYADGIHDSLYRAAGRALTRPTTAAVIPLPRPASHTEQRLHA